MLPGEDGLSLCRSLRAESSIPIIMLTAKGDEVDRVIGLEMGADDYLPKPFGSRELVARIKAVLRRSQETSSASNPAKRPEAVTTSIAGGSIPARASCCATTALPLPLSTGEYDLLIALVERPQRVLSRDQLLDLARGRAANALDRSIDTQVSRLRRKLEHDPSDPKIIKTVWGGGYMFTPAVSQRMSRLSSQEPVRTDPAHPARRPDCIACDWLLDLHRGPRAGRARRRRICDRPAHRQSHALGPGHTGGIAATHCRRA